jgi:ketosteroid isomerase-like protein
MSPNKNLVETYLASSDRSTVAHLLAEDVEWVEWADGVPPTGARTRGRAAFIQNFGSDELRTQVSRMIEEGDTVVAEGSVTVHKKEGTILSVRFCNLFELERGKIKRLTSYGALVTDAA